MSVPKEKTKVADQEAMEDFVDLVRGFRDYDIGQAFIEADVDMSEGHRFSDPIYDEVWG